VRFVEAPDEGYEERRCLVREIARFVLGGLQGALDYRRAQHLVALRPLDRDLG
jgi:hypothetical protein